MCHKSSDSPTFRNEGQDYHCKTVNVGGGKCCCYFVLATGCTLEYSCSHIRFQGYCSQETVVFV